MKSPLTAVKNKIVSKYTEDNSFNENKSTDINILLNRVKLDQKRESRKKIFFSGVTCFGVLLVVFIVF